MVCRCLHTWHYFEYKNLFEVKFHACFLGCSSVGQCGEHAEYLSVVELIILVMGTVNELNEFGSPQVDINVSRERETFQFHMIVVGV